MATFKEYWKRRDDFSSKASETVRNSAIAGLAAVWLFSGSDDDGLNALSSAPWGLLVAGAFFAATLGVDILHYYVAAKTVADFTRGKEKEYGNQPDPEADFDPPKDWMKVPTGLYNAKVFLLFGGYLMLTGVLVLYAFCK